MLLHGDFSDWGSWDHRMSKALIFVGWNRSKQRWQIYFEYLQIVVAIIWIDEKERLFYEKLPYHPKGQAG
ncbi:hypothetical protein L6164_030806 [Bauhinia variegata]|uniref:Uncharacterized protein n=1 Tax=Bauhinia variegata TaxID=167791 RepID=A0ACB9LDI9_BAUVA|nr:hypothetical protein L6164_030806 [Bauhinia variegata]